MAMKELYLFCIFYSVMGPEMTSHLFIISCSKGRHYINCPLCPDSAPSLPYNKIMAKNTHLEHLEDDILNNGTEGGKNAIKFSERVE